MTHQAVRAPRRGDPPRADAAPDSVRHSGARVVVVENREIGRAGLRSVLADLTLTRLVGEAATAAEAERLCRASSPDVVLVNLDLPDGGGPGLIGRLRRASPRSAVVVLSADDDPHAVVAAVQAGARGYVLMGARSNDLAAAVDRAVAGESFVDPAVGGRLVQLLAAGDGIGAFDPTPAPLTARELEVLNAIARGRSNKEIASDLHVAAGTAKAHVERILRKLTATNRTDATMRAMRLGLLDAESAAPTTREQTH